MTAFEGHTPGPWKAVDDVGGNHWCPRGENAKPPLPCPCDFENRGSWSLEGPPPTCWVGDHDTSLSRRVDAELAAAAPDLLAILRQLIDEYRPDVYALALTPEQAALVLAVTPKAGT